MGPRKRTKPNEPETEEPKVLDNAPTPVVQATQPDGARKSLLGDTSQAQPQSTTSWYGGTWPRGNKSTPVTQVAKESITAAGTATAKAASDMVASARTSSRQPSASPLRSPSSYLLRRAGSSTRSLPLAAATTKLNITSSANDTENGAPEEGLKKHSSNAALKDAKIPQEGVEGTKAEASAIIDPENGTMGKETPVADSKDKPPEEGRPSSDSAGWLGWFARAENNANGSAVNGTSNNVPAMVQDSQTSSVQRRNSEPTSVSPVTQQGDQSRSWLGIWGGAAKETSSKIPAVEEGTVAKVLDAPRKQPTHEDKTNSVKKSQPASESMDTAKSYGWAFWSRDDSRDPGGKKRRPSNVGELALAGSPSQHKPESAVVDESRGIPDRVSKRPRPESMQEPDDLAKTTEIKNPPKQDTGNKTGSEIPKTAIAITTKAKKQPDNLVLPSFKKTFRSASRPGLIRQLSRLFQIGTSSEPKHVEISSPYKVNRALAIGVHGYFPAPLIRSVLGQPTGTSIRFANSAASAIQRWTQDQGYSCEIEKVALEGEGKIAERIDLLWKLMLNWIEKIRKADFVMIACHSQGVPVAMILVAKLIAFGCVNSARIGFCAMAGVNMGPFNDYKSRWISGSAGELFDFAIPDSNVSKDYEAALDTALKFGVRIVYIGSIDDQLVSLESSTFGTLSHPYIYRAVFVDGRVHAPDFLTHLVGFALKLRNLGISDHGLIRELSSPLAGSLYSGEGHSRIYDDEAVYYLAVEHALETTSVGNVPMQIKRGTAPSGQNPYILPFAMRGLLEEEYVRTELYGEITELIRQFDDWKPSKTVLKDVKFRLEGVRSKL